MPEESHKTDFSQQSRTREPRLRMIEHYWIPTGDSAVQIRGVARVTSLSGAAVKTILPKLTPLLDGTLTGSEIIARGRELIGDNAPKVLQLLISKGLVETVPEADPELLPDGMAGRYDSIGRYFAAVDRSGSRLTSLSALRGAHVIAVGLDRTLGPTVSTLCHAGIGGITVLCDSGNPPQALEEVDARDTDLVVGKLPSEHESWVERIRGASLVLVGVRGLALFDEGAHAINRACIEAKVPWIPVARVGRHVAQIGPYVVPGQTGCLACLRQLYERNTSFLGAAGLLSTVEAAANAEADDDDPITVESAASLAAVEAIRALAAGQNPVSTSMVLTFDSRQLEFDHFKVLKSPRCPECGPTRGRPMMRIWG